VQNKDFLFVRQILRINEGVLIFKICLNRPNQMFK